MAHIIKCKTCGANISEKAKTCPHCGEQLKMSNTARLLIGSICVIVSFIMILFDIYAASH